MTQMTRIMTVHDIAGKVKDTGAEMASLSEAVRNKALEAIAEALKDNTAKIIEANRKDIKNGEESNLPQPLMQRLKFDEEKIAGVINGTKDLIGLPDPLNKVLLKRELDRDLLLEKVSCPIGVIGVIFESRPDALVQIATLCVKTGNGVLLKGGAEASSTNEILFKCIYDAGISAGLPDGFMAHLTNREEIKELLACDEYVDLIIPRGSNEFVKYIMDNSNIPVMGHSDGICHVYADKDADMKKAIPIIIDSKVQYVAACNAVETLLVHEAVAEDLLPKLLDQMKEKGVHVKGCGRTCEIIDVELAGEEEYRVEYLDYVISIKVVDSIGEAIEHINRYGSHHTDAIVTENMSAAEEFMMRVDSADVYMNCSTRFADGYRYGFGAEVGISTGKLHARGPVGPDGLVTYKYRLYGNGQTVDEYSKGLKEFHFIDL